jgi:hypothetical protein
MALNANTYYSNSIQGIPGAGVDVNIQTVDANPRYHAGYMIERADGNVYRYCHIGTPTNAGNLVGPSTNGQLAYTGGIVTASASAVPVQAEYPILPGQVGSHWLQVTIAGIAANKYQGGYLITTGGTGLGQTYRIVGNTATGTPVSGQLYIQLNEALQTAITATTGIIIQQSMFCDLSICPTASAIVTGVLTQTTSSTNQWGWVCTKGTVGCAEDGTNPIVAGQAIMASGVVAGAYAAIAKSGSTLATNGLQNPVVGFNIVAAGATGNANRQGVISIQME